MKEGFIKNIKDLEYYRELNRENISIVLLGTFMITVFLTRESLPFGVPKSAWLMFLSLLVGVITIYFNKKLEGITEEIKNL